MTTRLPHLVLAFGTLALSALAYAQDTGTGVLKLPQDIEFRGPLTGPPQTVVLYGDPTKAGVFVSRVKFSAGWKDPPHWHPDEVRTVVVLSGTLYFGRSPGPEGSSSIYVSPGSCAPQQPSGSCSCGSGRCRRCPGAAARACASSGTSRP